ncbi:MAG: hypothetical protein JSS76_03755 [Bacteroidetes bacterium]|nr:hypothetical protein [Bacteroidota bacterium]
MSENTKKPFIFEIQNEALNQDETKVFKELFLKYVNKTGGVPKNTNVRADYSLSNCRDTATDCTCDIDD